MEQPVYRTEFEKFFMPYNESYSHGVMGLNSGDRILPSVAEYVKKTSPAPVTDHVLEDRVTLLRQLSLLKRENFIQQKQRFGQMVSQVPANIPRPTMVDNDPYSVYNRVSVLSSDSTLVSPNPVYGTYPGSSEYAAVSAYTTSERPKTNVAGSKSLDRTLVSNPPPAIGASALKPKNRNRRLIASPSNVNSTYIYTPLQRGDRPTWIPETDYNSSPSVSPSRTERQNVAKQRVEFFNEERQIRTNVHRTTSDGPKPSGLPGREPDVQYASVVRIKQAQQTKKKTTGQFPVSVGGSPLTHFNNLGFELETRKVKVKYPAKQKAKALSETAQQAGGRNDVNGDSTPRPAKRVKETVTLTVAVPPRRTFKQPRDRKTEAARSAAVVGHAGQTHTYSNVPNTATIERTYDHPPSRV